MDIFYSGKKRIVLAAVITMICCILMVMFPSTVIDSARKAINLWMLDVLPALLPFFICAAFLQNIGVLKFIGGGIFPFAMSVLSGYPMGAGIIGNLRRHGDISLADAKKMLSYCSTSGPAFIIGAVGAGMLGSGKMGMIIAAAHYIGALMNGFLYGGLSIRSDDRRYKYIKHDTEHIIFQNSLQDALTEAILAALKSVGVILAYIVMFMFITDMITASGILTAVKEPWVESLIKGIIEMTVGCEAAAGSIGVSDTAKCILCSFMISWGGLSIIGQTMSMLSGTGMSMGYVLRIKLTHGLFSAASAFVITLFML